jgi:murein DD-endopeptidase MepM/ murein hydrolase activator NlpD
VSARATTTAATALAAAVAALAACSSGSTICERTGRCVEIAGGGVPIEGAPPLPPAAIFRAPTNAPAAISSTFGPRWKASASRDDFHLGIDYYGALGDPLLAIGDGRVTGVYRDGSATYPDGGNVVVIEHAIPPREFHGRTVDRIYAVYLHTDTIGVAIDQMVTAGQQVATMGKTGDTDFVHLHFETRVESVCSLAYQLDHPDCAVGFDPHVHPYLFVGGANADRITVEELPPDTDGGFTARYTATRGDLDLDVIETDLGALGFDTRIGLDARSLAALDDFDYGFLRLVPIPFLSTSETLAFELHFPKRPAFLELRDIYGRGLRFGERPP